MSKEKLLINDIKSNNSEFMRNKQIDEMAKVMANGRFVEPDRNQIGLFAGEAETLYNAGYRKQSGWINVEERLPQQRERVLCYSPGKKSRSIFVGYIGSYSGFWLEEPCYCCISEVTHWMQLPEAPKMRKEDEGK